MEKKKTTIPQNFEIINGEIIVDGQALPRKREVKAIQVANPEETKPTHKRVTTDQLLDFDPGPEIKFDQTDELRDNQIKTTKKPRMRWLKNSFVIPGQSDTENYDTQNRNT